MSLIDKASLVQIPSGYGEDKLYSVVPDNGAGDFTFSRSSTGTRVNSDGYIEEVPWNLASYSEDYSSGGWVATNLSVTTDDTTSPRGDTTADKITTTASGIETRIRNSSFYQTPSTQHTFSAYAKKGNVNWFLLRNIAYGNLQEGRVWFDLENGVLGTVNNGFTASIEDVGDGWFRCSMTCTTTSNPLQIVDFSSAPNDNDFQADAVGEFCYVWGVQLVKGTLPKPYIKTTDRLDVPRLDYSGGASCPTLLLEPQSTNLVTQSETFSNWNTEGGKQVVTQGVLISPDGTLNGNKLETYNTASSNPRKLWIASSVTVGASYTFSVYIKQVSGQINSGFLHITTGANDTKDVSQAYTATDQWQRVSVTTNSAASSQIRFLITGDANSQIYIWGAQVEQQSYATSYIPTSGSTVTRNADVCDNAGTAATFNSTEGVLFAEIAALSDDQTSRAIAIDGDGTNENRVLIQYQPSFSNQIRGLLKNDDNSSVELTYVLSDITDYAKIAFKYKSGDLALWVNGVERDTSSDIIFLSNLQELSFDNGRGSNNFFGKCKQLIYFNEALTDTELAALTTI